MTALFFYPNDLRGGHQLLVLLLFCYILNLSKNSFFSAPGNVSFSKADAKVGSFRTQTKCFAKKVKENLPLLTYIKPKRHRGWRTPYYI